jgi:hypothetical protein
MPDIPGNGQNGESDQSPCVLPSENTTRKSVGRINLTILLLVSHSPAMLREGHGGL